MAGWGPHPRPLPKGEGRHKEAKKDGWGERPPILFRNACDMSRCCAKGRAMACMDP